MKKEASAQCHLYVVFASCCVTLKGRFTTCCVKEKSGEENHWSHSLLRDTCDPFPTIMI